MKGNFISTYCIFAVLLQVCGVQTFVSHVWWGTRSFSSCKTNGQQWWKSRCSLEKAVRGLGHHAGHVGNIMNASVSYCTSTCCRRELWCILCSSVWHL